MKDNLERLMTSGIVEARITEGEENIKRLSGSVHELDSLLERHVYDRPVAVRSFAEAYLTQHFLLYKAAERLARVRGNYTILKAAVKQFKLIEEIGIIYEAGDNSPLADHMRKRAGSYRLRADQTEDMDKSMRLEKTAERYDIMADKITALPF